MQCLYFYFITYLYAACILIVFHSLLSLLLSIPCPFLQETLQLRPVGRRDAGLYTCQAQNSVGTSEQLSVQLDVKCKLFTCGFFFSFFAFLLSEHKFEITNERQKLFSILNQCCFFVQTFLQILRKYCPLVRIV